LIHELGEHGREVEIMRVTGWSYDQLKTTPAVIVDEYMAMIEANNGR